MKPDGPHRCDALLNVRLDRGADAAEIGKAVVQTWQAVSAALTPVLGMRGVTALYGRCVHLIAGSYPWLAAVHVGAAPLPDLQLLAQALTAQTPVVAAAGGAALMRTLEDLLASLIGPALTDQLLSDVWIHLSGGPAAQDNAP